MMYWQVLMIHEDGEIAFERVDDVLGVLMSRLLVVSTNQATQIYLVIHQHFYHLVSSLKI